MLYTGNFNSYSANVVNFIPIPLNSKMNSIYKVMCYKLNFILTMERNLGRKFSQFWGLKRLEVDDPGEKKNTSWGCQIQEFNSGRQKWEELTDWVGLGFKIRNQIIKLNMSLYYIYEQL